MTLKEQHDRLGAELAQWHDPQTRLAGLLERARQQPSLPAALRTDRHRVAGCLAHLWIVPELRDGRCWFRCDSDSQIVRAVASLLCELANGATPADIAQAGPSDWADLHLDRLLTPNRRNALTRVWETIRAFAAQQMASGALPTSSHTTAKAP